MARADSLSSARSFASASRRSASDDASSAARRCSLSARALPYLARACEGDSAPPSPGVAPRLPAEFVRECRRMIADAGYRIGDFARARTALERLAADAPGEAERLRALDMRARVDWANDQGRDPQRVPYPPR